VESIGELKRSHSCGELSLKNSGQDVVLMGWVQKRRDHGGVIFLDLRDRSGVVQVVLSPDTGGLPFQRANSVRAEFVLAVRGQVRRRPPGTENPQMATGEVEVATSELEELKGNYLELEGELEERLGDVKGEIQAGNIDVIGDADVKEWQDKLQEVSDLFDELQKQ
jgi:aspartyl-tRNA synthetase